MRRKLEEYVKSNSLQDDVIFTGYVKENIMEYINRFDIFAFPSHMEGLPYVILEAMSAEKAIVASDINGIPEEIVNGVSGILVPPRDPKALSEAIISLLNNPQKGREMGVCARKRFLEFFTIEKMIASIEGLYEQAGI
jgi:glycosyltransferase involved in cell wall biosynthesis